MANQNFDRTILNPLERPLADDINQGFSQGDRTMRDLMRLLLAHRHPGADGQLATSLANEGFLCESFRVVPANPASMNVVVTGGIGFAENAGDAVSSIDAVTGLDDLSAYKPMVLSQDYTLLIGAAPGAGQTRIDIVCVKVPDRRRENPTSRDVFDPGTGHFIPDTVLKTLAFDCYGRNPTGIVVVPGTAAPTGTEVAPATPVGYVRVADVLVVTGTTSITTAKIIDRRTFLTPGGDLPIGIVFDRAHVGATVSNLSIVAPPGFLVAVCPVAGDDYRVNVFVLVANVTASEFTAMFANMDFMMIAGRQVPAEPFFNLAPTVYALVSGDVTAIATATGVTLPVGHPAVKFTLSAADHEHGTGLASCRYNINGRIRQSRMFSAE